MSLEMILKKEVFSKSDFESLFKNHFAPLCYYAQKFIYDEDASREIVHDIFVKIWEGIENIDNEKPIKSYLYTAVRNRCFNYIRDNKKFNKDAEINDTLSGNEWQDTSSMEQEETESRVWNAINELPEKCREIFIMSRFDELKYNEIALKKELSVKTVEAQMSKALKHLRNRLSDLIPIILLISIINFLLGYILILV